MLANLMKSTSNRLTYIIALVWLLNGLVCKVLNFVPRHQQIVAKILGDEYAWLFTKAIGISEICMVIWILSGIRSRWCAYLQISIVAMMNVLEFILVPDLLLWGHWNAIFAFLFILVVYYNEFYAKPA
jgi:uncharacterized membrane protein YkgB